MTDSARTFEPSESSISLPAKFLALAKQIESAENVPDTPGGVTVTYDPNGMSAKITATIPLERIDQPDGSQILKPINFLK